MQPSAGDSSALSGQVRLLESKTQLHSTHRSPFQQNGCLVAVGFRKYCYHLHEMPPILAQILSIVEDLRHEIPPDHQHAEVVPYLTEGFLEFQHLGQRDLLMGSAEEFDGVVVVNSNVGAAFRRKDATNLQQPGISQVVDMRKDRAAVNELKGPILKWQVGDSGRRCKAEAVRPQVLSAPVDLFRPDVNTPHFAHRNEVFEVAQHTPTATTDFQDAIASSQT